MEGAGRMENIILVPLPLSDSQKLKLEAAAPGWQFIYAERSHVDPEDLRRAQIIIGNLAPEAFAKAENLKFLQLSSAGADAYVKPGVLPEGTILTNATGAYDRPVAEYAFAAVLMLMKKFHLYRDNQNRSEWIKEGRVRSLSESVVLIAGLGNIGLCLARMLKAAGAEVIGIRRHASEPPAYVDRLYVEGEIDSVLPEADVVISILPSTEETRNFFDRNRFAQMQKGTIFVNAGRGDAVDESALLQALRSRHLEAAAIDVTEQEPLPADSPLWQEPNLFITPHVAGGFNLITDCHQSYTLNKVTEIAADNLRAFLAGGPMRNLVDFSTGYCRKQD